MRLPSGGAAERAAADALDRFWDGLTLAHSPGAPGGPSRPDELLDPGLAQSVRRLRLLDATPRPEPGFANQLWSELMSGQDSSTPAPPEVLAVTGRLSALARHRVVVELTVAAALLLVLLGGGAALNLPVALDPAAPTAAASAGAAGTGGATVVSGCARTVTPEPTRTALQLLSAPDPTSWPVPTASANRSQPC